MTKEREIKINADNAEAEKPTEREEGEFNETAAEVEIDSPAREENETGVNEKTVAEKELSEEEKLKNRVAELEDKLLRTMADFDNYKKRTARQFDEIIGTANEKLIVELLEVVDNFERALEHGKDKTDFKAFRKGTELIFHQMKDFLARYDVRPIEAVGQPFDPARHEAVMQLPSDEYDEGVVAMEMTRGYLQGNRVIRYSKVAVSTGKDKEKKEEK
ncbi:MAG: nucleotide exchange factor GrpE [candidate division Zixibacteria bacterium]|nr:nucleotide exchange factor GrpE [candidate division Zixibacteria bacterium]